MFLHDLAGCYRASATQTLLDDHGIQHFKASGTGRWAGKSPDCNPAENAGAIVIDRCEKALCDIADFDAMNGSQQERTLVDVLNKVLGDMEYDTQLFEKLNRSFHTRIQLLLQSKGLPIKYH